MKKCSKRKRLFAAAGLLAVAGLMTGPLSAQTALSADGVVESTSGGFKFPDGSVQLMAALTWVESTLNAGSTACTNYTAGTFSDWRLPNIRELSSLVDFSQSSPALPAGHPFANMQLAFYWSSTSNVSTPGNAFSLNLWSGRTSDSGDKDSFSDSIWPVRGGQ